MGLCEVPLSKSLLGFWDGDYVSQLPYVWYYFMLTYATGLCKFIK